MATKYYNSSVVEVLQSRGVLAAHERVFTVIVTNTGRPAGLRPAG
jgi:hypothetical protein